MALGTDPYGRAAPCECEGNVLGAEAGDAAHCPCFEPWLRSIPTLAAACSGQWCWEGLGGQPGQERHRKGSEAVLASLLRTQELCGVMPVAGGLISAMKQHWST